MKMDLSLIKGVSVFFVFFCFVRLCEASPINEAEDEVHHREKRFPKIPMGTSCDSDVDCPDSHCCAMHFGRQVCRRRPGVGDTCVRRPNPLQSTQLFTRCPCSSGLQCSTTAGRRKGVCATG